ncbi:hypothetical protein E2C01_008964 [Portunus trituberculatus]|uniref:Uncharacterized protein n=1 Tax=Portunus trituberculatus TaxID=210409 RepID=A0A5B7D526_PORTR|nr:hypothetical protein [Portunus trituberculatus]
MVYSRELGLLYRAEESQVPSEHMSPDRQTEGGVEGVKHRVLLLLLSGCLLSLPAVILLLAVFPPSITCNRPIRYSTNIPQAASILEEV